MIEHAPASLKTAIAGTSSIDPEWRSRRHIEIRDPQFNVFTRTLVATDVDVTLTTIDECLSSRISATCALRIIATIKRQCSRFDQNNDGTGMTMPARAAVGSDDDRCLGVDDSGERDEGHPR